MQFPVLNSKSLKSLPAENAMAKGSEITSPELEGSEKAAISTLVYPNPSKGLIKIQISNMPLDSRNEMRLYDLHGTELIVRRDFPGLSEIDITHLRDGIYILRVRINEKIFDFKIILNR